VNILKISFPGIRKLYEGLFLSLSVSYIKKSLPFLATYKAVSFIKSISNNFWPWAIFKVNLSLGGGLISLLIFFFISLFYLILITGYIY